MDEYHKNRIQKLFEITDQELLDMQQHSTDAELIMLFQIFVMQFRDKSLPIIIRNGSPKMLGATIVEVLQRENAIRIYMFLEDMFQYLPE